MLFVIHHTLGEITHISKQDFLFSTILVFTLIVLEYHTTGLKTVRFGYALGSLLYESFVHILVDSTHKHSRFLLPIPIQFGWVSGHA